jgi:hypothetical protein
VAGSPQAAAPAAGESDRLDDKSASQAHGPITLPPAATAAPAASVAMNEEGSTIDRLAAAAAAGDKAKEQNALGAIGADQPAAKTESEKKVAAGAGRSAGDPMTAGLSAGNNYGGPSNAAAPAGAPYGGAPGGGGGAAEGYAQQTQPLAPAKRSGPNEAADPYNAGMAAYRARNYAEATKQLDAAAANGDQNAALWAARSTKEGQGCATALGRFENVAKGSSNAWIANEASLEAARCQIAMGNLDPARDRLNKLTQVPSHAAPAKTALDELNAVAARRQAGTVGGASHASKAAAPAPRPAAAPAAPKATTAAPRDHAAGF